MFPILQRMHEDNAKLVTAFVELQASLAQTPEAIEGSFGEFESQLLAHMEGEERYLFPILADELADEVRALREEHEQLRRLVADLSLRADRSRADRLLIALEKHARREDGMLYKLAAEAADNQVYQDLIGYLERLYSSLRDPH